jgi:hypothetical protein
MSNYTKLTDFASKDALPTGNAAKIVKGTEIDDEFEAIETSIATKADLDSPALTGAPTAPTASTGTDTTQIATTAFVNASITADAVTAEEFVNAVYPVGSVYINAGVATNPATLLGHGTWVAFGAGKVMVGLDSGDTDFNTLEETGGEKEHTLTVDELPSHSHPLEGKSTGAPGTRTNTIASGYTNDGIAQSTEETGGDQPHNNLQPYIVVHMWKRTA